MKLKQLLTYKLFKFLPKKYNRIFNSFYKHKLNSNLIDLIKKEVQIQNIYDIGAYKGEWSTLLNNTSLKNKNFFLFEANEENEIFLKKLNFKYFISVLSDKIKDVKFYSKAHTGDSYYLEQTNFYQKNLLPKMKKTNMLDNIVEKNNLPFPDFIKIDTQGSEIDILKGGQKVVESCKIILLECPIIQYNLGSPNLSEYINYLNSINFVPHDICETHNIDQVLIQIDILFIKKSIINDINHDKKILNILNS